MTVLWQPVFFLLHLPLFNWKIRDTRKLKIMQMQDTNSGQVLGGFKKKKGGVPQIRYNDFSMLVRILSPEFPCCRASRKTSTSEEETR